MAYGLRQTMPEDNQELVRRLSLRWMRAAGPHNVWATRAKQCTEFLEGDQWTEEQKVALREIKRSALTINKIAPLWRLVMGYQSSNRLDVSFLPTNDAQSSQDIGELLTAIYKSEAGRMGLKYADTDVFADGITGGRGFWDCELDFEENDFGETKVVAADPFATYIDPDCSSYDLNDAGYVQKSVWTDIDEIAAKYGPAAAEAVENVMSPGFTSTMLHFLGEEDVSPERFFGQYADDKAMGNWSDVYHTDFIDRQAKRIRLLDTQYKMMSIKPCFVDLETGDIAPIPDDWFLPENQHRIETSLKYAEMSGNHLKIANKPVRRVRRTVTCADVLLFDKWSIYKDYTLVGYFPYFRRGMTRGMIDDLIDPQMEVNKKRSVLADILNRNANSGWIYEEGSLDADQEENLRQYGSAPGINVKWKRTSQGSDRPARIEPGNYPQGLDRLEQKATDDLKHISGINDSAMGQLDNVQSGRAIEAKQRQAVISIQMYSDNFSRAKKLQGKKILSIFQKFYTEERVYRIIGEDSNMATHEINKKTQTGANSVTRLNDITVGKYSTHIDEIPISATFKQGQFEEMIMLLEKLGPVGMMLVQTSPELIIDQTSLPRKEEWKQGLMRASQQAALAPPEGTPQPAGGQTPVGPAAATPEKFTS